jgi:hypothetical protein
VTWCDRLSISLPRTSGVKKPLSSACNPEWICSLRWGYSGAGVVIAAGKGVQEFQPGDRVAGAGYASHCEVNFIPKNLAARVPD